MGLLVTFSCLQKYQEEPYTLAAIINWFLVKEKEILNDAELAQQVSTLMCYHHHHSYFQHHHQHILIFSLSLIVSGADVAGSVGCSGVGEPETNGKEIKRSQDKSRGVCVCVYSRVCVCLFKSMIHFFFWQVMEHKIRCLEEQQDEFDFKFQTHKMDCESPHFI